jgi:hypothetical protein
MKTKLPLTLLALLSFVLFSGFTCPPINGTGLGTCFLNGEGTGCVGGAPPSTVQAQEAQGRGGFDVYTEFEIVDIPEVFRADAINGVTGKFYQSGGTTYGSETTFGPTTSGAQVGVTPPAVTVNSGLIISADGMTPGQWFFTWGTTGTGYNSQWAGYLQKTFGPLQDESGKQYPQFCNGGGYVALTNVDVADTVSFVCILTSCGCKTQLAGVITPSNIVQPLVEEAGNFVDLIVTPNQRPSGGFVQSQTGVMIFDASGKEQNCFGYNGSCRALTVGGTGNGQITIPAGWFAYADDEEPGDYYAQIQTLVNGTWKNFDTFGFEIRLGGVPVFRSYSPSHGTHYWSQTRDEGSIWPYDYRYEGIGFWSYDHGVAFQPAGSALSLYRMSCCNNGYPSNGAWLLTDNSTEIQNAENVGWIPAGLVGNIMPTQNTYCGGISPCYTPLVPLYRIYIETNGNSNFFYTANYTEYQYDITHGWISQGIQGYVPTQP